MNKHLQEALALKKQIEKIKAEIQVCFQKYLDECPVKLNQTLKVPINAYVHQGKKMIITGLRVVSTGMRSWKLNKTVGFMLQVSGRVLRKDGKPGGNRVSFDSDIEE